MELYYLCSTKIAFLFTGWNWKCQMSMKYNKLSFFPYITIFIDLLIFIFAAVYEYALFLFMLWNLKTHNRVHKQISFCLLSSAVYSCCLHNVSTWIVKPCRTYLLSFVIISYFLLLFLSRSSHFFFLHFCAYYILSPDSFFVPVIIYYFDCMFTYRWLNIICLPKSPSIYVRPSL